MNECDWYTDGWNARCSQHSPYCYDLNKPDNKEDLERYRLGWLDADRSFRDLYS